MESHPVAGQSLIMRISSCTLIKVPGSIHVPRYLPRNSEVCRVTYDAEK
jgi:hypothetical protein